MALISADNRHQLMFRDPIIEAIFQLFFNDYVLILNGIIDTFYFIFRTFVSLNSKKF